MTMLRVLFLMTVSHAIEVLIPPESRAVLQRITVLRKLNMNKALDEIRDMGFRAQARGITFSIGNAPYGIYFVKYVSTFEDNEDGRWN